MTLTIEVLLVIGALICAIVDALRPTPYLLNVGVALLAIALLV